MLTRSDESLNKVAANTLMVLDLMYLQRWTVLNCKSLELLMTQIFAKYFHCPKVIGIGIILLSCNKICNIEQ